MVTEKDVVKFGEQCANIFAQVSRDVIGQKEVVEGTIIAMIAGGNVLLEGVPGVGKTRLVRSLGRVELGKRCAANKVCARSAVLGEIPKSDECGKFA